MFQLCIVRQCKKTNAVNAIRDILTQLTIVEQLTILAALNNAAFGSGNNRINTDSKRQRAGRIYHQMKATGATRAEIIDRFMAECDMTHGYASLTYQQLKG